MIKRIDASVYLYRRFKNLFRCPICSSAMSIDRENNRSLVCVKNHCFDFSRHGFVNFLLSHQKKSPTPGYGSEALQARRAMLALGLFDPLTSLITELIHGDTSRKRTESEALLLDVGSGEGYLLSSIVSNLRQNSAPSLQAVGLDISREGIRMASQHDRSVIWCIANTTKRLPFSPGCFSVVMNILSPHNLSEFRRILRKGSLLIKVVPENKHLIELRQALYEHPREHPYSDEELVRELGTNLGSVRKHALCYTQKLSNRSASHLIRMTPLFWKAKKERIAALESKGLPQVTCDFSVIVATVGQSVPDHNECVELLSGGCLG